MATATIAVDKFDLDQIKPFKGVLQSGIWADHEHWALIGKCGLQEQSWIWLAADRLGGSPLLRAVKLDPNLIPDSRKEVFIWIWRNLSH